MKAPDEDFLNRFAHAYDAAYAREYYLRTRKLKGRKRGHTQVPANRSLVKAKTPQRTVVKPKPSATKAKQRQELQLRITSLENKLKTLEQLIKKKMHEEASENRKSRADANRKAKEKDKPKSRAEKAKEARESAKYRDKHKQELKSKAKKASSKGGSSSKTDTKKKSSAADLKVLATRVRGQLAIAKQKLAAL